MQIVQQSLFCQLFHSVLTNQVWLGLFYKHLCDALIQSVILLFRIFKTLYISNCKSWEAEFLENVHPPPPPCAHVTCHVSNVMRQVSRAKCRIFFFWGGDGDKVVELVGGGSAINEADPHLVSL